uniref:SHSP domain-containing protein n=1 Tax=Acrobeloides nanus TaxID=290746 RepID=A0A914E7B0_9BILA
MQNFIQPYAPTLGYGLYPFAHPTAELGLSRVLDAFFDDSLTPRVRDFAGHLTVKDNGDFEYKVDASGFRPEEVKVDLEGNDIIITANHEEKREHESVTRHFTRRIRVPEHIQKDSIQCDLDKRGHLQITGHGDKITKPKRIPIYRVHEGKSLTQDPAKATENKETPKK